MGTKNPILCCTKLWPIGEMSLEELKFLPKVYVGMVQLDENTNHFF
jgi:hypothetical protein